MKHLGLIFTLLLALTAGGCINGWHRGGTDFVSPQGYALRTPPGWIYQSGAAGSFLATKDGFNLQRLSYTRLPLTIPLPSNKRVLTSSLSPIEVAEAMIDDLKSNRDLRQLTIETNTPATIGGQAGAKLIYSYINEDDLRLTTVNYVFLHNDQRHELRYTAPSRFYFKRDLPEFEAWVRSFTFTPTPGR